MYKAINYLINLAVYSISELTLCYKTTIIDFNWLLYTQEMHLFGICKFKLNEDGVKFLLDLRVGVKVNGSLSLI